MKKYFSLLFILAIELIGSTQCIAEVSTTPVIYKKSLTSCSKGTSFRVEAPQNYRELRISLLSLKAVNKDKLLFSIEPELGSEGVASFCIPNDLVKYTTVSLYYNNAECFGDGVRFFAKELHLFNLNESNALEIHEYE